MARIERIREVVSGPVDMDQWKLKTDAGWKLVALEWRREIEGEEPEQTIIMEEIPYGLRVANDCTRLEENPEERNTLFQMMELIVQEHTLSHAEAELTRRGLRTRAGEPCTPVAGFNMLR